MFKEILKGAPLGNDNAAKDHVSNASHKASERRELADKLKSMPEDELDNLDVFEYGYSAYTLYEAEKMMPKKDGAFKNVTDSNSFKLHEEADAVVNVGGKPHLATLQEDPDDEDDGQELKVWQFRDPANPSEDNTGYQTDWKDKEEAVKQYKEHLAGKKG